MSGGKRKTNGQRMEGSIRSGPVIRSSDPFFEGMSATEKLEHINRVAKEGGLSGLDDFFAKALSLAVRTRKTRGEVAIEFADSMERDVSKLAAQLNKARTSLDHDSLFAFEALMYRAVGTGVAYAHLRQEIERGSEREGATFSTDEYFAAMKKCRNVKVCVAGHLGVSVRGLNAWEKKKLA